MTNNTDIEDSTRKYIAELQEYYHGEYLKQLNLDIVKDPTLRARLLAADLRVWSQRNRIVRNIQMIKYSYCIEKTKTITTCLKATYKGTSCIYSYIHSRHQPATKGAGTIEHGYVCNSPTYRSQDGEYRHRLIPWAQFEKLWTKYYDIFEPVESMILKKMNSRQLTFQADFYYPTGFSYSSQKFERQIDEARIPIRCFIFCWLIDFQQIYKKTIENHINPAYQYVIFQQEDVPLFESILQKLGSKGRFIDLTRRLSRFYYNLDQPVQNIIDPEVGQKIFPLTVWEVIKAEDINFNVWREIYFTNICSNLVLNMISPSFPFIVNWFYIQNTHGGLFDNLAMHEKYRHSEIATDISTQLKNVDKLNYAGADISRGTINNRFTRLSKYVQKAIIYVDSAIRLTDLSICMTSEYVGRTLRDIPVLTAAEDNPAMIKLFGDIHVFRKHIFEFIYGFYCMNTKAGLFHGDLHMNNATIFQLYMVTTAKKQYVPDPRIVYIVQSDETYIFPHLGTFSMIIDYSRAIMGNFAKLEHEFGMQFAERYFREQRFRVMQISYHYFPKIMEKYHEKMEGLLISNFPLMFKILSAVDTFVICTNIAALLTIDEAFTKGKIQLATGIGQFLVRVIQFAESLIISNLQSIFAGKIQTVDDIEWPNLLIIRQCFEDYKLDSSTLDKYKNADILDIYNYTNSIKSDIEDYDTWGSLLSLDHELELRKKYNLPEDKGITEWLRFKDLDESLALDQIASKYEHQEKDLLKFESWMLL